MNRTTFSILAVVAAILVLLAVVGQRRDSGGPIAGESVGSPLLPELAAGLDSVGEILIDAAGPARVVSLERTADGWIVDELDGYTAAPGEVGALLIALGEARIVEEKTANPDFYSRLGVEPVEASDAAGLELTLVTDDGGRFGVVLGDAYGSDGRYARRSDARLSVLIDRDPEISREPSDWVEPQILAIEPARVQQVEIMHADGERLVLAKPDRDAVNFDVEAIPDGRELQYAGVGNVTGSVLQNLRLEEVARQPAETPSPVATTVFRTFDGLVITATASAEGEGDPWLTFAVDYDAAQALAFADETVDDVAGEPAAAAGAGDAAGAAPDRTDVLTEVEAINARLGGWRYRIPSYQYGQMTRRMNDLLRAPPAPDE